MVIFSKSSIASKWVEYEVKQTLKKEETVSQDILLPIMVDDAVLNTTVGWATSLKATRNIGDFREWKNQRSYQQALERLLRDLRVP